MRRLVLLCLSLTMCAGACRNLSYVSFETVPEESDVVEGETRYGEVLASFGAPIFLAEVPGGFAMLYERIVIAEGALGLKLAEAGYFGGSEGKRDYRSCLLLFDDDGVLREVLTSSHVLGTGSGVQVATSGEQGFLGGRDYGAGPSPFTWGRRSLNPLPILLNERWSRIEIGEGGLELFDTPRTAGQHTLARPAPPVQEEILKL